MTIDPPELCDAESCGYRCDRERGHGAIHHHPEPSDLGHHDWWVYWPHGERVDNSGRPRTGYMLIADVALPLSNETSVTNNGDIRITELWLQAIASRFGQRNPE